MLSNISIPLLGIVDTAILGHLNSPTYLGAVSVGSSIMAMVAWTFSFLRTSTTGLTAQQHGANDTVAIELSVARAIALSVLISLVLLLLRDALLTPALAFVDASERVDGLALSYSQIRFYSLPAVLITYCLSGWMIGVQNTRAVMLVIITTNVLNIALDYAFIIKLGLNSDGAAWATVVSEYTGCLIALTVFLRRHSGAQAKKRVPFSMAALIDGKTVRNLLQMNADLMVRTFCLLFCFLFFTAKGAQQGDTILAANAILLQLVLLAAFALDGFAHAAESLCGYAIGERSITKFRATVKACLVCCLGASAMITLGLLASQQLIVYNYSSIDAVQASWPSTSCGYLPCLLPQYGVICSTACSSVLPEPPPCAIACWSAHCLCFCHCGTSASRGAIMVCGLHLPCSTSPGVSHWACITACIRPAVAGLLRPHPAPRVR